MSGIRVLVFGAWDTGPGYPRSDALLGGLRRGGVDVSETRIELPRAGAAKRRLLSAPWLWPGYVWSLFFTRRRAQSALREAIHERRPDVILVPYPGHIVVRWVRAIWTGPVVLDLFLSAYDTAVLDRALFRPESFMARWLRRLDRRACAAADRVLLDTEENATFVAELVDLPRDRFRAVPVSVPARPQATPYRPPGVGQKLELLFFGTGVPLHGLDRLLDAIENATGVRLTLIGGSAADRRRAAQLPPEKIRVLDEFVPAAELDRQIDKAHLVAGVFGTSPKADRVVPLKLVHGLAAGRPVITGDTTAVRRVLRAHLDATLVPPGDPLALATALQDLADQPERLAPLAAAARQVFDARFSLKRVGESLLGVFSDLCASPASTPTTRRARAVALAASRSS